MTFTRLRKGAAPHCSALSALLAGTTIRNRSNGEHMAEMTPGKPSTWPRG